MIYLSVDSCSVNMDYNNQLSVFVLYKTDIIVR